MKEVDFVISVNDKNVLIYPEEPVDEKKQQEALKAYVNAIAEANNGEK